MLEPVSIPVDWAASQRFIMSAILTYFDVPGISIASCCDGYTVSPIVNGIFNQFCFVWSKHVEGGIIPKQNIVRFVFNKSNHAA